MSASRALSASMLSVALACRALPRPAQRARPLAARAVRAPPPAACGAGGLCIIDGHALAYRMNFALQSTGMSTRGGLETHALHGFVWKLLDLATVNFAGYRVAVAFDLPGPTFRTALQESYKQNRPTMPLGLRGQMAAIQEACGLFGVPALSQPGFEADDVIATCVGAARAARLGTVAIVTTDKDLMQLVSAAGAATEVVLWNDRTKQLYNAAGVEEKHGVAPHQMGDYLALVGDSSDNVPGVPGIGPKRAATLLAEHGDLEGALAGVAGAYGGVTKAGKPKKMPKWAGSLLDGAEAARHAREMVRLREDVPLPAELALGAPLSVESEALLAFLRKYELAKVEAKVTTLRKRRERERKRRAEEA